jgi:hypothetical protein
MKSNSNCIRSSAPLHLQADDGELVARAGDGRRLSRPRPRRHLRVGLQPADRERIVEQHQRQRRGISHRSQEKGSGRDGPSAAPRTSTLAACRATTRMRAISGQCADECSPRPRVPAWDRNDGRQRPRSTASV